MPVPILSYVDIVAAADQVYRHHNPQDQIPVDIETIIDVGYQIDIYPSPNLMDRFQIDAYISRDLREIHVDKRIYEQRPPNRYRFSLAHEFGHLILHADVYREMNFHNPTEWKTAITTLGRDDYNWLEYHANAFAGLLLVPPHHLTHEVGALRTQILSTGTNPDQMSEPSIEAMLRFLAGKFGVSAPVIANRLRKDRLWVLP